MLYTKYYFFLFFPDGFWKITTIDCNYSRLWLKSIYNSAIILFSKNCPIFFLTTSAFKIFVFRPSFIARFRVCLIDSFKLGSQEIVVCSKIAFIIYIGMAFNHCYYQSCYAFTISWNWQYTNLRSYSSILRSQANDRQLISNTLS